MKKRKIFVALSGLFTVAFLITMFFLVRGYWVQSKAEKKLDQMVSQTTKKIDHSTDKEEPEEPVEVDILTQRNIIIPEKNLDWAAFQKENADIYAWILVPGTKIDYPVLQHPTEVSFYLTHNMDGSKGYPGCIYSQNLNTKDFMDPNTVLYGHNMDNGTMFRSLHSFEDQTFFEQNRYVYMYTPTVTYVYEIFAAYEFSDAHLLYNFDFDTPSSFQVYLDSVRNVRDMNAHVKSEVGVTSDNHIITLSTCIKGKRNNRYLVQAVLINDPTKPLK